MPKPLPSPNALNYRIQKIEGDLGLDIWVEIQGRSKLCLPSFGSRRGEQLHLLKLDAELDAQGCWISRRSQIHYRLQLLENERWGWKVSTLASERREGGFFFPSTAVFLQSSQNLPVEVQWFNDADLYLSSNLLKARDVKALRQGWIWWQPQAAVIDLGTLKVILSPSIKNLISMPLLRDWERVAELYQSWDKNIRYELWIFRARWDNKAWDGLTGSGISILEIGIEIIRDRWQMNRLVSHELLHLIHGDALQWQSSVRSAWFEEGWTEYLSLLVLWKLKLIDQRGWQRGIEEHANSYWQMIHGGRATEPRRWAYDHGFLLALALDHLMNINGHRDFTDLWIYLMRHWGKRPMRIQRFKWLIGQYTGLDLTPWLNRSILDLEELLRGAHYHFKVRATERWVWPVRDHYDPHLFCWKVDAIERKGYLSQRLRRGACIEYQETERSRVKRGKTWPSGELIELHAYVKQGWTFELKHRDSQAKF